MIFQLKLTIKKLDDDDNEPVEDEMNETDIVLDEDDEDLDDERKLTTKKNFNLVRPNGKALLS